MTRESRRSGRGVTPPRRALIGGALIMFSAFGVFSAHRGANKAPEDRFIVALHDIAAGTVIEAKDLGAIALDLPEEIPATRSGDADLITGRVASNTITRMELVDEADLYPVDHFTRSGATTLVLDLAPARAMHGIVAAGDVVSVLSTDPQGSGTERLTADALVVSTNLASQESIGSAGMVRVVLSVPDPAQATAITDASITSELTLQLVTPSRQLDDESEPSPKGAP